MSNAPTRTPSPPDAAPSEGGLSTTLAPDQPCPQAETAPDAGRPSGGDPSAGTAVKHYEIIRPLGRGGMGAVYLARDTKLGRLVAIKLLLKRDAPDARRFLSEARATARCKHENIVVIHEVDEFEGRPYMVLEHLEGRTLRDWLVRHDMPDDEGPRYVENVATEPVPPGLAVELTVPVVRALACAHEQGIVHRDLKPENIMLTDAGPVKVLDFGIAKRLGAGELAALPGPGAPPAPGGELTNPGARLGTLPYMAPEQWNDDTIDARTDLWAVGVILFRLVTGAHPLAPISWLLQLAQVAELDVPMPPVRERRPDVGPLGAIIDRCLQKRKEARFASARELLEALEALPFRRGAPPSSESDAPFLGLSSFQEADATRFFGRDADVASLLRALRDQPSLSVVGASGAGKSSFVRAGVIPALKRLGEPWQAFVVRPGPRPLAALADLLARAPAAPDEGPDAGEREDTIAALRERPGRLGAHLRTGCHRRRERALLFVDQFEELYTLGADDAERAAFLACLDGVADDASSPLRVVIALRSDFLDRLTDDRRLSAGAPRGLVLLSPMGREGLREALARPLEGLGYRLEGGALAERMLSALEGSRCPLPLLQFTAAALWQARDRERKLLTEASYDRLGGIAGALSAHADAVLSGLSAGELRACRDVLLRLVTPQRTRAVVSLGELHRLMPGGLDEGAVGRVVRRLLEARLLSVEAGDGPEDATVELVHESLIDGWPRLGRWLDEGAQDAHFLARLREAARQWHAGGEAEGLLWRDGAAAEARAWLGRRDGRGGEGAALGGQEERYLRAVVALSERSRRLRKRALAGLVAALSAFAAAVSFSAVRANREAALARNATRMAAAREMQADPTAALALLRELEPPDLPHGWATLADSALRKGVAAAIFDHPEIAYWATFSPDGGLVASASADKAVRLWRADGSGEPLVLRGHDEPVTFVAFSPDGGRVASASLDKTLRVWRVDGSTGPLVLRGHEDELYSAAFSPDGRRIATASGDKTVRVWQADGSGEPAVFRGHEKTVLSTSFSPDGRLVASASADKTVRIWQADGAGEPIVLRGHEGDVHSVAFSPGGGLVASASTDKTVRLWRADGSGEPLIFRGHEGVVRAVAWSPDGRRLASASADKTVRVWQAGGSGATLVFRGHDANILSASFSPDGRHVASASADKTVRVWRAGGAEQAFALYGRPGAAVMHVALSPDGRHIAVSYDDKTALVWGEGGTAPPATLRGHEGGLSTVAFSPDGGRVVTASFDGTARVWRADGSGEPTVLRRHQKGVYSAAFSPDGLRVVTASADRTACLSNADGTGEPVVFRGHGGIVTSAAFSPDGKRVVTASEDKTARLWRADGSGAPVVLQGHEGPVNAAEFSPDGKRVVTASFDGTARVWQADGSGEPLILRGHEQPIYNAIWSPDGAFIITASQDHTVRRWRADGPGAPAIFGHDAPVYAIALSPDGKRLVSEDGTAAWAWPVLDPPRDTDDPRLWAATAYCLPAERRIALLSATEGQAREGERACKRRVGAARGPLRRSATALRASGRRRRPNGAAGTSPPSPPAARPSRGRTRVG